MLRIFELSQARGGSHDVIMGLRKSGGDGLGVFVEYTVDG